MRRFLVLLVLAALNLPLLAARRVSMDELERLLATTRAHSDADLARQLGELELTERLSSARLPQLSAALPGDRSRQALLALADTSIFLPPPSSDIPATATPSTQAQRRMMALTVNYLGKTLPLLPNFFAARDTMRFESRPGGEEEALKLAGKSRVTVLYRNGREFVDAGADKNRKPQSPDRGLTTWGEFGPILGTVVVDAARSRLTWNHWELGATGARAVFGYSVPKEKSHYDVRFCCTTANYGMEINVLTQRSGYHGEIAVDPDSGAVLRLTVVADIEAGSPIGRASVAVEYGAVELGGKTYYCPMHGVAIAQSPDLKTLTEAFATLPVNYRSGLSASANKATLDALNRSPQQTLLNDVSFREYHLLRADARVVAGDGTAPAENAQTGGLAAPNLGNAVDAASLAAQPAPMAAPASPSLPTEAATSKAEAVTPEILLSPATGLPETPALSLASGATLRLTARLVDLPVVAVDKKSRPINNLRPEDFEVYDEGQKVPVRSFAHASTGADSHAAATQSQSAEHLYTNRGPAPAAAKTDLPANTVVMLLDCNLSFDDLSLAREQMLKFLRSLPEGERVALYTMQSHSSFKVIEENSNDHPRVAAALAKWKPLAFNIAEGELQEVRNRRKMEDVANLEDLLNVNGHQENDASINVTPLDPNLRELGDHPAQNALDVLVDVARHLGALPGHKSLVWVASDNVLADWTQMSVTVDKTSHYIDAAALRTQEAMNNAHVSVYPLNVSRLEGGMTDASIGQRNVGVKPTNLLSQTPGEGAMHGSEFNSGTDVNTNPGRDLSPGRLMSQMQQDIKPIQGVFREIAEATGGRAFRRASDIAGELDSVAADGRATYLLSFSPVGRSDGKYHLITVKAPGRKDVTLRYRTGYVYRQESSTLRQRFADVLWQPEEAGEIGLTADPEPGSNGRALKLNIAATDLEIAQNDAFWTGKVDVFVVQRKVSGKQARITGQTLGLHLSAGTYQKFLKEGIPFNQPLEPAPGAGSIRIVVLDENSGRMGTLTLPAVALTAAK